MSLDQLALDTARKIDDIYAGGYFGTAQRTSLVQIAICAALRKVQLSEAAP